MKQSEIGEVSFQNIVDYYGKDNLIVADSGAMQKSSAVTVSHSISNTAQTKGFRNRRGTIRRTVRCIYSLYAVRRRCVGYCLL